MALADNLAALLEPALLIITGGIIGTLVVAMYLPIFPFRRCDEWDGITLACCSTPALGDYRLLKMRFSCSCTRINVVRLVSSFQA